MSDDDTVKPFPKGGDLPDNPLRIEPIPTRFCTHEAVSLDQHTRTIRCADLNCGAVLDPFDFLLTQARTISRAWQNYAQAARQAAEAVERVSVLLKEEKRLRAAVRRLQDKSGSVRGRT